MKTLKEMDFKGKRVLVRVDFNVPLKEGEILDDEKIKAVLPTINYLIKLNCIVTLISHLGRPEGKYVKELSLRPVAKRLAELSGFRVTLFNIKGRKIYQEGFFPAKASGPATGLMFLENIRFHPEEEAGSEGFAKEISEFGEVFVQEAFACCHRAHASIVGPPKYLPSCAGFLLEKEIKFLSELLTDPKKPFVAVLGGNKVSDKILMIENLLNKVDVLLIGGAMAYTFLQAKGVAVGKSFVEENVLDVARAISEKARQKGVKIFLPTDYITINPATKGVEEGNSILPDCQGMDIGSFTSIIFETEILEAKTIFWNGPVGVFEDSRFENGTKNIALAVARATQKGAISVIGGGSTIAALKKFGVAEKVSQVSTGGGASLEFLEGKILPGIAALEVKNG